MDPGSSDWFDLGAPPTRRFAIYLPSRTKNGSQIEHFDQLSEAALELLSSMFGGATSYAATGMFKGEHASSEAEEIRMLECFCSPKAWDAHATRLRLVLQLLARSLEQESIACSLDGQVAFVSSTSEAEEPIGSMGGMSAKELLKRATEEVVAQRR